MIIDHTLEFRKLLLNEFESKVLAEKSSTDEEEQNREERQMKKRQKLYYEEKDIPSVFIQTASMIRDEIYQISDEVAERMKHYLRTWSTHTTTVDMFEDMDGHANIDQALRDASGHITQLEQLLSEAEKQNAKRSESKDGVSNVSFSSHQRAHYRSIIIYLCQAVQEVSNRFKQIREMQAQNLIQSKQLFETKQTKVNKDEIEKLRRLQALQQEKEERKRNKDVQLANLPERQLLLLRSENSFLQEELDAWVQDAQDAEKSALELGELIGIFDQKVSEQAAQIETLYESAKTSQELMHSAKLELEKAKATSEGKGSSWIMSMFGGKVIANLLRYFLLYLLLAASFILLFLDLICK